MKKIIAFLLLFSMMSIALYGCGATPKHFTGEWQFSKISKVEIDPNVSEATIAGLIEDYDVTDKNGVIESVLAEFVADGTFDSCYIKFSAKKACTYDPIMVREAAWAFYQTAENEGFLSYSTELNAADGNPDPSTCPAVVYDPATDTLSLTLKYGAFLVTVELSR